MSGGTNDSRVGSLLLTVLAQKYLVAKSTGTTGTYLNFGTHVLTVMRSAVIAVDACRLPLSECLADIGYKINKLF